MWIRLNNCASILQMRSFNNRFVLVYFVYVCVCVCVSLTFCCFFFLFFVCQTNEKKNSSIKLSSNLSNKNVCKFSKTSRRFFFFLNFFVFLLLLFFWQMNRKTSIGRQLNSLTIKSLLIWLRKNRFVESQLWSNFLLKKKCDWKLIFFFFETIQNVLHDNNKIRAFSRCSMMNVAFRSRPTTRFWRN